MAARYITSAPRPRPSVRSSVRSTRLLAVTPRFNRWIDLGSLRKHRHHRFEMAQLNKFLCSAAYRCIRNAVCNSEILRFHATFE